ncbi:MAG: hypothetical protein WCA19_06625, partial [Candidatus Acidiferrales bacterium]
VSNGPDRAIHPPSALLTLLISHFQKLNHSHFKGLSTVVQQPLAKSSLFPTYISHHKRRINGSACLPFHFVAPIPTLAVMENH